LDEEPKMSRQKKAVDDLLPDEEDLVSDEVAGELVPDPQVCREFGVTAMTVWRWDHDPELNFPPPIRIRRRKFRHRRAFEDFKRQLVRNAIARRKVAA
jgi:predicted DNA-binding transcriptional regulator AlpA